MEPLPLPIGQWCLVLAAIIAIGTAIAHTSCIFLGPECYAVQMAPKQIVESAVNGTYLAPVGTLFVSAIFVLLGLYALSGANIIRPLPLLSVAMYTIATLCIIRGLLPIQLWFRHSEKISDAVLIVGVVWLVTGLLYLIGYRICVKQ